MPGKLKAIIAAGDRGKSHPVFGKNKAMLDMDGLPIILRVISAVGKAESVSEIFVVGPKQRIEELLRPNPAYWTAGKPIHVFEQGSNLYENIWNAFLETLPPERRQEALADAPPDGSGDEEVVLIMAGDMPLLTPTEVDEFVAQCDMEQFDYVVGVTREESLRHYYPSKGQAGVRLAYMHFSDGNFRQNNMHMVRPLRLHNRHYVQTMYDLRYQKQFGNILRLAWEILKREEGGWGAVGYYLLLQLSLLFARLRLGFLRDWVRKKTHADSVARCISKLMKTRFGYAYTSLGGAALDVDKEHEYEAIKSRFREWMNYQHERAGDVLRRIDTH